MNPHKTRVIFFPVKTSAEKLKKIIDAANYHFSKKEHLLYTAPDDKSASYLDNLLWANPPQSFLPHLVSEMPSEEFLVITKQKKNLNRAKYIFNLCPSPVLLSDTCRTIYEFEDSTSPNKAMLSRKKFEAYKSMGLIIESR